MGEKDGTKGLREKQVESLCMLAQSILAAKATGVFSLGPTTTLLLGLEDYKVYQDFGALVTRLLGDRLR